MKHILVLCLIALAVIPAVAATSFNTTLNATATNHAGAWAYDNIAGMRDMDDTTFGAYSATKNVWMVGYNFTSSHSMGNVRYYDFHAGPYGNHQNWSIQYSNDFVTWTNVTMQSATDNATFMTSEIIQSSNAPSWNGAYFSPVNGTYWRINFMTFWAGSDGNYGLTELHFFENESVVTPPTPPAIVADFTSNWTAGYPGDCVQFNDTSTGSPTMWTWNFGDLNTSNEQNPIHCYGPIGSYTVSLNASRWGS